MIPKSQIQDIKLEQQIQKLFSCVVLNEKLGVKALQKAKELMMQNIKQLAAEALDRSIYRDGTAGQLQVKDLLAAISTRGQVYKFKIARAFIMNKVNNQLRESNPEKDARGVKQGEFDDKEIGEQQN